MVVLMRNQNGQEKFSQIVQVNMDMGIMMNYAAKFVQIKSEFTS